MNDISTVQWACFAGAALLAVWSRRDAVKGLLGGLWAKLPTPSNVVDEDAAMLAAFKVIRPRLGATLAADVWIHIQPVDPPSMYPPEPMLPEEVKP